MIGRPRKISVGSGAKTCAKPEARHALESRHIADDTIWRYEVGDGTNHSLRRLILLSYHFPPGSAAGALRWEKLAHHACKRGWGLDVFSAHPAFLPGADESRLRNLPSGVRIFGVSHRLLWVQSLEERLARFYRRVRPKPRPGIRAQSDGAAPIRENWSSIAANDVRWLKGPRSLLRAYSATLEYVRYGVWAKDAAASALSIVDPRSHRAIVSCGPPHMAHEGARLLSLATGLPLVIDFRDPWQLTVRLPEAIAHPAWLRLALLYERRAMQRASLAIVNTDPCRVAMQSVYPDAHDRILTVMNGYDEDPLPPSSSRERGFRMAYAGSILLDRSPRTLFRAAAHVVQELRLTAEDFAIEFMGDVMSHDGLAMDSLAEQEGLRGFVRVFPARPRREALEFLGRASLLVSLPQDTHLAIPSKVFEYLRFEAPILALAEKGSATEHVLRETRARVLPPDDVSGIAKVIAACYQDHCAGRRPSRAVIDDRLSRRVQAQKLFTAIDEMVA